VLAPGTIAGDFVATVRRNTDQRVTAVASRRFAQFAIGRPRQIRAVGSITSTGVDEQTVVAISGPEGRHVARHEPAEAPIRHRPEGSRDDQ
jgi:hypothetical protein